jgi:hypothetical protein
MNCRPTVTATMILKISHLAQTMKGLEAKIIHELWRLRPARQTKPIADLRHPSQQRSLLRQNMRAIGGPRHRPGRAKPTLDPPPRR